MVLLPRKTQANSYKHITFENPEQNTMSVCNIGEICLIDYYFHFCLLSWGCGLGRGRARTRTYIKRCRTLFQTTNSCARSKRVRFTRGAVSSSTGGLASAAGACGEGATLLQTTCPLIWPFQTVLLSLCGNAEGCSGARDLDKDQVCFVHRWLPSIVF